MKKVSIEKENLDFCNMEIFERLKYLRKNILNLNQEDFAKRINMKNANFSRIENNTRNLTIRSIHDIHIEFSVREEWLRNGTGEIFEEKKDEIDNALHLIFEKLNEKNKTIVLAYLQFLLLLQYGELSSEATNFLCKIVKSGRLFVPKNLIRFYYLIKYKRFPTKKEFNKDMLELNVLDM